MYFQEQGYTIFVVRGQLPEQPHSDMHTQSGHGSWFSPEQAKASHQQAQEARQSGYLAVRHRDWIELMLLLIG